MVSLMTGSRMVYTFFFERNTRCMYHNIHNVKIKELSFMNKSEEKRTFVLNTKTARKQLLRSGVVYIGS